MPEWRNAVGRAPVEARSLYCLGPARERTAGPTGEMAVYHALLLVVLLSGLLPARVSDQDEAPACDLRAALEYPLDGATINAGVPIGVEGWAVDRAASSGTGILGVQVALDVPREDGGTSYVACHTEERLDVA